VGVVGPIATTADDLALSFSVISGPDPKDPKTLVQPAFSLKDYNKTDSLEGITIAVVPEWNKEVEVPAMVDHINTFVDHFKKLGATIVEIDIKDMDIARAGKATHTKQCIDFILTLFFLSSSLIDDLFRNELLCSPFPRQPKGLFTLYPRDDEPGE
jgi:Asp-tRNA(Asn)/Glu-tRNA(Gln) amidotransferase A subunit family amidase